MTGGPDFIPGAGVAVPGGKGVLPVRDHSIVGRCEEAAGGRETPI
ncbi:hypothetical protein SGL43_07228 [Streptomyces globisporus]|uniref:Uncharacterized protein n=1 Tax=Streptomyces globisporus TaxID=1908 RepID=A0ABN8VEL0_STRGL|nr:hypothetical protein SGL43_07228 [Streptomyces globisporus]